ncbi:MAG: sigma-70 family RNA polymerase sigma factor [Gemmatimonadaceae bacterium]
MSRKLSADRDVVILPHLIDRARAGEPSAIAELYSRYATSLFQTAYRITGARSDAEDVVHDLFVGLPGALKRYEDHGQLAAWLNRIVVRLALVRLRSDRSHLATPLDEYPLLAADRADSRADLNDLQRKIMELPDTLRAVLVLNRVEGYAHEEIAALLNISAAASRTRLSRAIEMLRRSLL